MLSALFCVSLCSATLSARPLERVEAWDKLAMDISNQAINLALPDGTRLRGIGRGVEADELVLEVRRSSNTRLHAKGITRIPRSEVSIVDVYLRHQSNSTRGAAIGVGAGLAAASPAAFYLGSTNHQGLGGAVLVAGAVAGWYIGHHFFDQNRTDSSHLRITVAPPQPQAP
jgi:hypothetical protein